MRFINALRLLTGNFKQVCRLLAYKLIMLLVFCALCCAFVLPELMEILENPATQAFFSDAKNVFLSFVDHSLGKSPSDYMDMIFSESGSLSGLLDVLFNERLGIVLVFVACVVVYLVKAFADNLVYFTLGSVINDRMSTYSETPLGTAFVKNLGKASAYAGVFVPVDCLVGIGLFAVVWLALRFLPLLLALFLSMTLIVAVHALKMTFIGAWMPAMTADGARLKEALFRKDAHEKKMFAKSFILYAVTTYLVVIVNVVAALCTFGSALLITIPASYVLFICEQYVNYYTTKGKKYFITYENIATNADHGDSAHFFEYIEEVEKQDPVDTDLDIM